MGSFLSKTIDCWAMVRAKARWSGVSKTAGASFNVDVWVLEQAQLEFGAQDPGHTAVDHALIESTRLGQLLQGFAVTIGAG